MDWCEKRFASLPWFTPGVISGISTDIKVIPACPIILRQMHFQCKCQQFVRARESEAKQMSLHCYCYGTGIHQGAAKYLPGNLAARSCSSRCLHTSEMHGNLLKNTDVGFGEVILSDQTLRFYVLVCFTTEQQSHCSSEAWFPKSCRARGTRRRVLTGGQKYNQALNLTESIKQRLI